MAEVTTKGDIAVGVAAVLGAFVLCFNFDYQAGYETARDECKPPPKTEVPMKDMTHKQQVRYIKRMNADKGVVK